MGKVGYLSAGLPGLNLLLDEQTSQENDDGADDTEDNNDTRLPGGPVLALHEVVDGDFAARGKRHIDGGHC